MLSAIYDRHRPLVVISAVALALSVASAFAGVRDRWRHEALPAPPPRFESALRRLVKESEPANAAFTAFRDAELAARVN